MSRTYIEGGVYPVSARPTAQGWESPGLAYEDYARMATQHRKQSGERRLPTPLWAVNDKLLRILLVTFMEERAGFRKPHKGTLVERLEKAKRAILNQRPRKIEILDGLCAQYVNLKRYGRYPDLSDEGVQELAQEIFGKPPLWLYDSSDRLCTRNELDSLRARELEIEIEGLDTYLRFHQTTMGGADKIAAIVYLYYRVGLDSVGVATALGLKPPHIRQTLWRLHETWVKLAPLHAPESLAAISKGEEKNGCATDVRLSTSPKKSSARSSVNKIEPESQPVLTGAGLTPPLDFD